MSHNIIEERGTSRPLPLRDAWGHRRSSGWWGEPGPQEDSTRVAGEATVGNVASGLTRPPPRRLAT